MYIYMHTHIYIYIHRGHEEELKDMERESALEIQRREASCAAQVRMCKHTYHTLRCACANIHSMWQDR